MADISDVEQAVADAVSGILYPWGPEQSSVVGAVCRVYRGWPNAATLNTDLSTGTINVTITTDNDSGRSTTRYLPEWTAIPVMPGVAISAGNQTIAISGKPGVDEVIGALIDGVPFTYRIERGESPSLVASNLNQLIGFARVATVKGSVVTVPGARSIIVRATCDQSTYCESRRQEKDLRIVCWCPTPPLRDAVASVIDSGIDMTPFLSLPDRTSGRISYRNTTSHDQAQNALLYRRDLVYIIEYATITTKSQPSMLFGMSDLNTNITYG